VVDHHFDHHHRPVGRQQQLLRLQQQLWLQRQLRLRLLITVSTQKRAKQMLRSFFYAFSH
jgi:hypothetical protein